MSSKRFMTMTALAGQAGEKVTSMSPTIGIVGKGSIHNFATAGDLASEKIIVTGIRNSFPDDAILSEETASDMTPQDLVSCESLWIIDPIDGTHNYRHRMNYSCVSIAYAENGIVMMGVVYNPFSRELYTARLGMGATLNGRRITVTQKSRLTEASIATDNGHNPKTIMKNLAIIKRLPETPWVHIRGAMALTLAEVAAGKIDLYFHSQFHEWDIAAGMLIVREGGGIVVDYKNKDATILSNTVIAGNPSIVLPALPYIKNVR